jgi:hypothetical protein
MLFAVFVDLQRNVHWQFCHIALSIHKILFLVLRLRFYSSCGTDVLIVSGLSLCPSPIPAFRFPVFPFWRFSSREWRTRRISHRRGLEHPRPRRRRRRARNVTRGIIVLVCIDDCTILCTIRTYSVVDVVGYYRKETSSNGSAIIKALIVA